MILREREHSQMHGSLFYLEPRTSERSANERKNSLWLSHKPWSWPNLFTLQLFMGRSLTDSRFNFKKWAIHFADPSQNRQRLVLFTLESIQKQTQITVHSLCFISNAYKQQFYPLVKFLKKLSNTTSLFQVAKQHHQKIKQQKLVNLNFCLSNNQSQFIFHVLQILNAIWIKIYKRKTH